MHVSDKWLAARMLAAVFMGLTLIASVGCGGPVLRPSSTVLREVRHDAYSDRDWAIVLRDHIRYGLVDYDALREDSGPLMRYCALVSLNGPNCTPHHFPSRAHEVAYYVNAYNALVLRAVLSQPADIPTMYDLALPQLEYDYKFPIDRQEMTLAQIESKMLETSNNDVRTLLCTSRAAMGSPRLTNEPLRAETLDRQLAQTAAEALDLPEILRIDHSSRRLLAWQLIMQRENNFLEYWKSQRRVRTTTLFQVLSQLASPAKHRAMQSAVGYAIRANAFDRALNRWDRRAGGHGRNIVP